MPAYCFENKLSKELFSQVPGVSSDDLFTFEELIAKLTGFTRTKPSEFSPLDKTIETLRESLILTEEHLAHCFSSLPDTPKNQALHRAGIAYLRSNKSHDWTEAVWNALGLLKDKKVTATFSHDWIFVKDSTSSFLFQEFAKAFVYAPGVASADIRSLSHCTAPPAKPYGLLTGGNTAPILLALVDHVAEALKETPQIHISFAGSEDERVFLSLALASKGIELKTESPQSPDLFSRIRNSDLPISRRLKIWHDYKLHKNGATLPDEGVAQLLLSKELLSQEEYTLLFSKDLSLSQSVVSATSSSPSVTLLPWSSPIWLPTPLFAYAGTDLFQFDEEEMELTLSEREILFLAGFQIPRLTETRKARLDTLNELLTGGVHIFTSLPETELEGYPYKKLLPQSKDPQVRTNAFAVPELSRTTFSATQLESYATCPTKYLFENRLKIRRQSTGMESLPLLNGQVTHRALELYFALPEKADPKAQLLQSFTDACKEICPHLNNTSTLRRHLTLQFEKVMASVLRLESELDAMFGLRKPKYFEKDFELSLDGFKFRGKIDRIDELADGSLLVLDYKTGNIDFTPDHIRQGSHFQAMLYLLGTEHCFSQPVAGMLFYDLKNTELRRGILIEERVSKEAKKAITRGHTLTLEKFRSLLAEGENQARALCASIEAGHFDPTPSSVACSYCDIKTFCGRAYGIL